VACNTATLPHFTAEKVAAFEVPSPPIEAQRDVVSFLDRETAEIDSFIADQEELIDLLAERRAATVIHAVTKGLDPTVPTRDSGISWLGTVPAHWTVARVKNAAEILAGYAFSSDDFSESEDSIPLLRGINVAVGFINWDESVGWDQPIDAQLAGYHLRVGDIVVGLDRPVIAKGVRVARVRTYDVPSLLLQRVARLRATGGNSASFIEYALSGRMFADYLEPIFTGVSVPHISPTQLGNFPLALPDPEEQAAIARRLGADVAEIDAAISDAREAVALSRERRAALISAAVTGKIDVRGAA
jgi:type I restriction enzyme, S subunit